MNLLIGIVVAIATFATAPIYGGPSEEAASPEELTPNKKSNEIVLPIESEQDRVPSFEQVIDPEFFPKPPIIYQPEKEKQPIPETMIVTYRLNPHPPCPSCLPCSYRRRRMYFFIYQKFKKNLVKKYVYFQVIKKEYH